ncbi:MAG TPA: hypothetical protein VKZ97_00685 [Flavobacteriaceae bacterium]|nr:hypothetical protein [Flavobacteriaceae bacterium]
MIKNNRRILLKITSFISLLSVIVLSCKSSIDTHNIVLKHPFEIRQATYSSTNNNYGVTLVFNQSKKFEYDSIYLVQGVFKPQVLHYNVFSESVVKQLDSVFVERAPVTAKLFGTPEYKDDYVTRLRVDLNLDTLDLAAYKNPFSLKQNEAMVSYRKKNKTKYFKVELKQLFQNL